MKDKADSSRRIFIKQLVVSSAAVAVGTNLLEAQNESSGILIPSSTESKSGWNQSILIPVHVKVNPGSVQLVAGEQTISFTGELVQLDADQKLVSKWTIVEREFTTLSLKVTANSCL